jgi:ATP-dependent RNA circularization protein (DNA/RNA ligase family)
MDTYEANTVVLQGETIGEGIQKNKYGIKGFDFYAFNLIIDGVKIDSCEAAKIVKLFGIKWVPILDENFILLPTIEEMLAYAEANSTLKETLREGVVIRDHGNTTSFKCISNAFLLKHNI